MLDLFVLQEAVETVATDTQDDKKQDDVAKVPSVSSANAMAPSE